MKICGLGFVVGMIVITSGCGTRRVSNREDVSSITTTTETTTVMTKVVETVSVSASKVQPPEPNAEADISVTNSGATGGDILEDAKKPCGTIAADAPKFVCPPKKQEE